MANPFENIGHEAARRNAVMEEEAKKAHQKILELLEPLNSFVAKNLNLLVEAERWTVSKSIYSPEQCRWELIFDDNNAFKIPGVLKIELGRTDRVNPLYNTDFVGGIFKIYIARGHGDQLKHSNYENSDDITEQSFVESLFKAIVDFHVYELKNK